MVMIITIISVMTGEIFFSKFRLEFSDGFTLSADKGIPNIVFLSKLPLYDNLI